MSDQNETYVRAAWELVHRCDGSYRHYVRGTILLQDVHAHWHDFPSWSAARQFTKERLEAIRQVEEEIAWLKRHSVHKVSLRILASLQAALTDLQRGLKLGGRA